MNDREKWRERVRDTRADDRTWWWWWWWWWWWLSPGKHSLHLLRDGVPDKIWIVSNAFRGNEECALIQYREKVHAKLLGTVTIIHKGFYNWRPGCILKIICLTTHFFVLNLTSYATSRRGLEFFNCRGGGEIFLPKRCVRGMTLKYIWSSGDRGGGGLSIYYHYSQMHSVTIPSIGQIHMFENYWYSIKPSAKIKNKK